MGNLVAVYGSLRKGFMNHQLLGAYNANSLGTVTVRGWLMVDLGAFPMVVPSADPSDSIEVEVYSISHVGLDRLDVLEGVSNKFYERVTINTQFGETYMYQYHPASYSNMMESVTGNIRLVYLGVWQKPAITKTIPKDAFDYMIGEKYSLRVDAIMREEDDAYMWDYEDIEDPAWGEEDPVGLPVDLEEEIEERAKAPPPPLEKPYLEVDYYIQDEEDQDDAAVSNPAF
jgi:gamma-glutamylcyclotransferase (GGCT)/AIG2-like uncharacterized protein YtfP